LHQFLLLLQIVIIFILPICLIQLKIISVNYRLYLLAGVSAVAIAIMSFGRWSFSEIGIRTDNISSGLLPYTIFTLASFIAILMLASFLHKKGPRKWYADPHFLFLFIPISILQELLYRSLLMHQLGSLFSSATVVIVVNTILFGYIHTIYPHKHLTFLLGILSGLGFSILWYFIPNLYLISISHMILNFVAVWFGLFTLLDEEQRTCKTLINDHQKIAAVIRNFLNA